MNGITKEQIEQARRVGILAYMRAYEPQELVKVGRSEYTTRTHDSLRISENGKWNWCSRGFGGTNALNYLVRVKGLSFVSAVQQLCEDIPAPAASASQTWERPPNSQTLMRPPILLIPQCTIPNAMRASLCWSRSRPRPVTLATGQT